jgi:catechol 2,3-dioxygenase-like lactoylglutathione lyase family enzyme
MPITRVESIVYGTDDVAAGIKYFEDWGLPCREKGMSGAKFALPTGQTVEIRGESDSALPAAIEKGPTARETTWGVDSKDALEAIGAELSRDRAVTRDSAGGLHAIDDIGLPIAFRVAAPGVDPGHPKPRKINQVVDPAKRPEAIRLGHVVYFCPKAALEKATAFYIDRLKFRTTEKALDLGTFMRCEGSPWHHNLFFLAATPRTGWNHVAFDVADMEEVMNGGHNMLKQGYKAYSSPGRHIMGSNIFWYFNAVTGGQTEYSADMDMFDDTWQPRVWDHNPGIDMWCLQASDILAQRYGPQGAR